MILKNRRFASLFGWAVSLWPRFLGLLAAAMLLTPSCVWSQLVPGSMDVRWDEGASRCSPASQPPLQVHPYNDQTFILRENLCATFEAPFMYLLIGSKMALLIDTGDVPDSSPVAEINRQCRRAGEKECGTRRHHPLRHGASWNARSQFHRTGRNAVLSLSRSPHARA